MFKEKLRKDMKELDDRIKELDSVINDLSESPAGMPFTESLVLRRMSIGMCHYQRCIENTLNYYSEKEND